MTFTQAITFKRLQDISVNSANVFFTATFNLLVSLSAGNSWWKHTGIISKKQPAFHLFRTRFAVFNIFFSWHFTKLPVVEYLGALAYPGFAYYSKKLKPYDLSWLARYLLYLFTEVFGKFYITLFFQFGWSIHIFNICYIYQLRKNFG